MGPTDEHETEQEILVEQQAPAQATRTVHHKRVSEMEPLRALPEEEEPEGREEDEPVFEPGPIFGEGM